MRGCGLDEIFISYARSNEAVAGRVANALKTAGFDVWRDDRLPAHRTYSEVIEQKLRTARAVVVLWSAEAVQSQWVRAEADLARLEGKLVQAVIDDTLPPIPFNQIQCASLKGWRGKADHPGWAKVMDSVVALVAGETPHHVSDQYPARRWRAPQARWLAALALALLLAAAAFLFFRLDGDKASDRPVVAVLPFESLDNRDESLVAGIWEDTRHALSANPQLLVLGPNTSEELAAKDQKQVRKAADFLVQASVRSNGDRVRINASLTRTDDGAQVWSEEFERRLDDVFLLQQQIAGEIEGRIRGRLARGGGVKPENIATTGEVYALYSDARARIRSRQSDQYAEALSQLKTVVEKDPNFAPGWATLSVATEITGHFATRQGLGPEMAEPYARRAIALAPNLAVGHAALGLALGDSAAAEAPLRRAVELDPNDIEALNWLANALLDKGRTNEALSLYTRIAEIEPLWPSAIANKLQLLVDLKDFAGAQAESARLQALGAENLHVSAEMAILQSKGDLSAAAALGVDRLKAIPRSERFAIIDLHLLLIQLGYVDEFIDYFDPPPSVPYLLKNDPKGLDILFESEKLTPRDFFNRGPLAQVASRVYIDSGRSAELVRLYHAVASSPDELIAIIGEREIYAGFAPLLALALREQGEAEEADRLLAAAESILSNRNDAVSRAMLARVHAVQGRKEDAIRALSESVRAGWLPAPPLFADLRVDPALALLKGDPRFERLHQQLLGHIRKERTELGPITLNPAR